MEPGFHKIRTNWKFTDTAAAVCFAAGGIFLIDSAIERESLTVRSYEVRSPKVRNKTKIVFLADLHEHAFGPENVRLIRAIEAIRPDCIVLGGDMITAKRTAAFGETLLLLKKLTPHWPVYYGEGNHEARLREDRERFGDAWSCFSAELRRFGVTYLRDRSVLLSGNLALSGLSIPGRYYGRFPGARALCMPVSEICAHLGRPDPDVFQILLAHSPDLFPAAAEWGADLTLSGHYHGGTIQLPHGIGLMTPQFQFFRRDVTGMHGTAAHRLIVSPGLGTHSVNLRINNRPQIIVIALIPERKGSGRRREICKTEGVCK